MPKPRSDEVTPAELRTVALAAEGLTEKEIADRLGIQPSTVNSQLDSARQKWGLGGAGPTSGRRGKRQLAETYRRYVEKLASVGLPDLSGRWEFGIQHSRLGRIDISMFSVNLTPMLHSPRVYEAICRGVRHDFQMECEEDGFLSTVDKMFPSACFDVVDKLSCMEARCLAQEKGNTLLLDVGFYDRRQEGEVGGIIFLVDPSVRSMEGSMNVLMVDDHPTQPIHLDFKVFSVAGHLFDCCLAEATTYALDFKGQHRETELRWVAFGIARKLLQD